MYVYIVWYTYYLHRPIKTLTNLADCAVTTSGYWISTWNESANTDGKKTNHYAYYIYISYYKNIYV